MLRKIGKALEGFWSGFVEVIEELRDEGNYAAVSVIIAGLPLLFVAWLISGLFVDDDDLPPPSAD